MEQSDLHDVPEGVCQAPPLQAKVAFPVKPAAVLETVALAPSAVEGNVAEQLVSQGRDIEEQPEVLQLSPERTQLPLLQVALALPL